MGRRQPMMRQPQTKDTENLRGLPRPGETLSEKYEIEGFLGAGGMAVVLAARHLALSQKVAIKFLLPQLSKDPAIVERFIREGRTAAKIRSEHVVRVFDAGEIRGRPYLVLERLDGTDLGEVIAAEGPQQIARAVEFVLQACEALAEAHVAGIVHRDLKPANLFLCHRADGSPCIKVLDFGISKVGASGILSPSLGAQRTLPTTVMGSPLYMSPEQLVSAADVHHRADIWSLGAILHELLAGKPTFQADTMTAICARVLRDSPAPLTYERSDVPTALEGVVLRCLDKEPLRRFPNVAELARALVGFGPLEACVSAERVGRIVEGESAVPSSPELGPVGMLRKPATRARIRASSLLETVPPPPMTHPLGAYAFIALTLFAFTGGMGQKVVAQTRAIRDAERRRIEIQAASSAARVVLVPPPAPSLTTRADMTVETTGARVAIDPTAVSPPPSPRHVAASPRPVRVHSVPPHRTPHTHHPVDPPRVVLTNEDLREDEQIDPTPAPPPSATRERESKLDSAASRPRRRDLRRRARVNSPRRLRTSHVRSAARRSEPACGRCPRNALPDRRRAGPRRPPREAR